MKSTFHSAILALALSVSASAAPLENYSSANKGVHSSTHHLTPRGGPSGGEWYDELHEASGPPMFFGDKPSNLKSPVHDDDNDVDKSLPAPTREENGPPSKKESAVTTTSGIPLFGNIKPTSSTKQHSTSTKASSTKSSSTKPTSTQTFSTYTSNSSKHTSVRHTKLKHTKTKASTAHKSTSTSTHKSTLHKTTTHNKKPTPQKSSATKNTLLPARLATPNFKSYIAKAGTLMFGMQNPICSAVTLIFARGTTEVGNMGTCVGPDLAAELRKVIPSLSVQGVDYPANSAGDTRYGASGGPYMAMLAREARLQCPETKIVLAGYSQGARCLHGALEKSERPFDGGDVAAVVAFGDPLNGKERSFKGVERGDVLQVCGDSDDRCQEGQVDLWVHGGHVSYGRTAEEVAEWIRRKVE
jgi:cutinase